MNLQKLHSAILSNGGASYSLRYGDLSGRKGYAVSVHKDREITITVREFGNNDLRNFVNENSDLLAMPDYFLGAWIEDNTVYLDVSKVVPSKALATKLCKQYGQKAYFDLANMKTIYVL